MFFIDLSETHTTTPGYLPKSWTQNRQNFKTAPCFIKRMLPPPSFNDFRNYKTEDLLVLKKTLLAPLLEAYQIK